MWSSLSIDELDFTGIFENVVPEAVNGLLESCEIKSLSRDEILLSEGQTSDTLYIVLEGRLVELWSEDGTSSVPIEKGDVIGEMSVIDSSLSSVTVKAEMYTRLLCITQDKFWRLINVSHEFSKNILMLLATRMREGSRLIRETLLHAHSLEEQTVLDPLTGLHNRRWLILNLPRLMKRARRGETDLTLLVLDIDHFKKVNDNYGHLVGDSVLKAVSQEIKSAIRPGDFACRYGGEEFIVIFPETSLEKSLVPSERIRTRIEIGTTVRSEQGGEPAVTISGGLADLSHCVGDMDEFIHKADMFLYEAKAGGRNRIHHRCI